MGYNTKELRSFPLEKGKMPKPKDVIYDPRGQWAHPGEITKIPSGRITMKGVNYPVLGIDDLGNSEMMFPDHEYNFPGNSVTEYPQMKRGGMHHDTPHGYTDKNIQSSINSLMTRNYMLFGPGGKHIFRPLMQIGGQSETVNQSKQQDPYLKSSIQNRADYLNEQDRKAYEDQVRQRIRAQQKLTPKNQYDEDFEVQAAMKEKQYTDMINSGTEDMMFNIGTEFLPAVGALTGAGRYLSKLGNLSKDILESDKIYNLNTRQDIRHIDHINNYGLKTDINITPYQRNLDEKLIKYNDYYGTDLNVKHPEPTHADRLTGSTDIPSFYKQINEFKTSAEFGKRPMEGGIPGKIGKFNMYPGMEEQMIKDSPVYYNHNGTQYVLDTDYLPENMKPYTGKSAYSNLTPNKFGGQTMKKKYSTPPTEQEFFSFGPFPSGPIGFYKSGGTPEAFPSQPDMNQFFNFGNFPQGPIGFYQTGGENEFKSTSNDIHYKLMGNQKTDGYDEFMYNDKLTDEEKRKYASLSSSYMNDPYTYSTNINKFTGVNTIPFTTVPISLPTSDLRRRQHPEELPDLTEDFQDWGKPTPLFDSRLLPIQKKKVINDIPDGGYRLGGERKELKNIFRDLVKKQFGGESVKSTDINDQDDFIKNYNSKFMNHIKQNTLTAIADETADHVHDTLFAQYGAQMVSNPSEEWFLNQAQNGREQHDADPTSDVPWWEQDAKYYPPYFGNGNPISNNVNTNQPETNAFSSYTRPGPTAVTNTAQDQYDYNMRKNMFTTLKYTSAPVTAPGLNFNKGYDPYAKSMKPWSVKQGPQKDPLNPYANTNPNDMFNRPDAHTKLPGMEDNFQDAAKKGNSKPPMQIPGGPAMASSILTGIQSMTSLLNRKDDVANRRKQQNMSLSDNQFYDVQGNRGDYNWTGMSNGMLRPDNYVPVQFPGMNYGAPYFQDGGFKENDEVDMSPEEMMEFMKNGGTFEII